MAEISLKQEGCYSGTVFAGVEVGAVSVKWAERCADGSYSVNVVRHAGDPHHVLQDIIAGSSSRTDTHIVAVGETAQSLLNVPRRSETECIEKALAALNVKPDILLSLGGETFSLFTLKNGVIKNIISTDKCAAGTGEFLVQQFKRMDLSLEEGIEKSLCGKGVKLATRCSVHCKSDATHKLNKGECTTSDIATSLIEDLASKIHRMIDLSQWSTDKIAVCGGVSSNKPFLATLGALLDGKKLIALEQSPYLEAYGAALLASELSEAEVVPSRDQWLKPKVFSLPTISPLKEAFDLLDYRVGRRGEANIVEGDAYILGVDAGSTTTKAVLYNIDKNRVDASAYLRTHGNPVGATKNCLQELRNQAGGKDLNIVQVGTTGSGREMVSVYLDGCSSLNEILTHARAAADEVPGVDTVFEIGGQDSKFISFSHGIPVDYAMNEGCSAGTGSFLEEAASTDLNVPVQQISEKAESSLSPIAFGERCAAFINTDLRNALQQGGAPNDVIGGLVYSIADNYISRIVGTRTVGNQILFQGGVALNRSVGLAMAARLRKKIIVPPYPELMGAVGTALMVKDLLDRNEIERKHCQIESLMEGEIGIDKTFPCKACDNVCEIQMFSVRGKQIPFGGLCSKFENQRHKRKEKEGRDLVAIRNSLMFEEFGARPVLNPRGKIGLAMALTAWEMFPFYTGLINALGYEVVLSDFCKEGNDKTMGTLCYPAQIAHGAVFDLKDKDLDFIFVPNVAQLVPAKGFVFGYACGTTGMIGDLVKNQFKDVRERILTPSILLNGPGQILGTAEEFGRLSSVLGIPKEDIVAAFYQALSRQEAFQAELVRRGKSELQKIAGEPTIILAGRPYTVCDPAVNLALPKKIASRGFNVVSADMLPQANGLHPDNTWAFTQQLFNAVAYAKGAPDFYVCLVSAYNCAPDVSLYHGVRYELAGKTFCYIEIDSHTAHAGVETRIGAFLDIVEEKRKTEPAVEDSLMEER
jgi:predicted CoA-substrate-specific enzyme activase